MDRFYYNRELFDMALALPDTDRHRFLAEFARVEKNPVALYGWNIWLGFLGVDRFIVGDIFLGILKLITFGGLGLWQLVDCFLIGNRARTVNLKNARMIYRAITGKNLE